MHKRLPSAERTETVIPKLTTMQLCAFQERPSVAGVQSADGHLRRVYCALWCICVCLRYGLLSTSYGWILQQIEETGGTDGCLNL